MVAEMSIANIQSNYRDLEFKLNSLEDAPATISQTKIQIDIASSIFTQISELKKTTEDLLNSTIVDIKIREDKSKDELLKIENYTPNDKNAIKLKKTELKELKKISTDTKNDIKNTLSEIKLLSTEAKKKLTKLKACLNNQSKPEEDAKSILEKCHNFKPLQFQPFEFNKDYEQHHFIASNPSFRIYAVDTSDAKELSKAFDAISIGQIFEELSFFLGADENSILIISEGALKYEFNPQITDLLKTLNARYNQDQKSWYVDCSKLGRLRTEKFHSCMTGYFKAILDIDNHLLYIRNDHDLRNIILKRKQMDRIIMLPEPYTFSKESINKDIEDNQNPSDLNVINQSGRVSIFNPIKKQFETLKKTSFITTKIPILLFRVSENNSQQHYIINMLSKQIQNPRITSNAKRTQYIYRAKIIDADHEDFSHCS